MGRYGSRSTRSLEPRRAASSAREETPIALADLVAQRLELGGGHRADVLDDTRGNAGAGYVGAGDAVEALATDGDGEGGALLSAGRDYLI